MNLAEHFLTDVRTALDQEKGDVRKNGVQLRYRDSLRSWMSGALAGKDPISEDGPVASESMTSLDVWVILARCVWTMCIPES